MRVHVIILELPERRPLQWSGHTEASWRTPTDTPTHPRVHRDGTVPSSRSTRRGLPPTGLGRRAWWAIVVRDSSVRSPGSSRTCTNLFVYDTITDDPTTIAIMVAVSAISATAAAFVVGAWSDRVGRRRIFIAAGYVLWGVDDVVRIRDGGHLGRAGARRIGRSSRRVAAVTPSTRS